MDSPRRRPAPTAIDLVMLLGVGALWGASFLFIRVATPLFALLLGALRLRVPLAPRRLAGVLLGLLGVAVLVGLGPLHLDAPCCSPSRPACSPPCSTPSAACTPRPASPASP